MFLFFDDFFKKIASDPRTAVFNVGNWVVN